MLKTRIIPTLLWKRPGLVKGIGFDSWRRIGTVLPAIKVYNIREVDELIVVDINATRDGEDPDYEEIMEFTQESFIPMTVGGGVNSLAHFKNLLRVGADKIAVNSAAYTDSNLISSAANHFGSQCVVASIDVKRHSTGTCECFSHSGTHSQNIHPVDWAKELEMRGAGEILITSIDRDGTMNGYDISLIKSITDAVSIPVIASGGAGSAKDVLDSIQTGGASAAAAASVFHFTEVTPLEIKQHLAENNIPVRIP